MKSNRPFNGKPKVDQVFEGGIFAASPGAQFESEWLSHSVILIFEITKNYGAGALVLNRPMPLRVRDLGNSGRFDVFRANPMYAGGSVGGSGQGYAKGLIPSEMSPWYWLHSAGNLGGTATRLSEFAYIGGNIESLAQAVGDEPHQVKFFWRHTTFGPGEFEQQVEQELWRRIADDSWMLL
eukprot:CAMPEP_0184317170 /NCGR_PEP_ID=MMETSP1049-20130417/94919_1 /TAXON_ID=77928 /ORGANISM="Proteomonas sulcata, Strain CCMP704" /LENGTH=180 /DNA_ID=CAMNT_0026636451 /DNA_START=138 /DNA_END=680 /DNA_ORIENTATION=+